MKDAVGHESQRNVQEAAEHVRQHDENRDDLVERVLGSSVDVAVGVDALFGEFDAECEQDLSASWQEQAARPRLR